jgi:hypothetical protein
MTEDDDDESSESNDNNQQQQQESQSLSSTTGINGSVPYTEKERREMKELIVSLSLESTDHDRRTKLKEIFHEALDRPNDMPKRFSDLFDSVLTQVGDQVQMEAKKKFFERGNSLEKQKDVGEEETKSTEESTTECGRGLKLKSQEELQLWALVDMMVQSKTIVKKHNGELGSKGSFQ